MNQIKVEIGQYREVNKGPLKAFFSVVIYPECQKILDCKYFVTGDNRWIAWPQKEIKYNDGRKTEYIPYISYPKNEYVEQLKNAILKELAIKEQEPQDAQNRKPNQVQAEALPVW